MKLSDLKKALGQVKPALAEDPMSRVFSYIWFDGKHVTTYNGNNLAIQVPLVSEIKGALPGKHLTDIVDRADGDEVKIVEDKDGNALLTAGKTSVKFATEDPSAAEKVISGVPFKPGKQYRQLKIKRAKDLLTALQCCDLSLGSDVMRKEQVSVCFKSDAKEPFLLLYSSNSITLSRSDVPCDGEAPELPKEGLWLAAEFCAEMVRYLTVSSDFTLHVSDTDAIFASENVSVYTQFAPPSAPVDFDGILSHHFPANRQDRPVPLVPELRAILERACVFVNTKLDAQARTEIEVRKGMAYFTSESALGRVEDELPLKDHPDTKLRLDPKRLLTAFNFYIGDEKHRGKVLFDRDCAILLRDPDMYHLVSAFGA